MNCTTSNNNNMRVSPTFLPPSRIEKFASSIKSQNILVKVLGWICVPFCCIGCTCIGMSMQMNEFEIAYSRLLEFYGGVALARQMAQKIRDQAQKFRDAVNYVNQVCDASIINSSLNMFELVKEFNPRFAAVCTISSSSMLFQNLFALEKVKYAPYHKQVWDKFVEYGGDSSTVIYGFIEYLIETVDPSSTNAMEYVREILADSSLRNEVVTAGKICK